MHVGLFFGSFNPIHFGHLRVAQYFLGYPTSKIQKNKQVKIEEVWMVLSPQNPFKENHVLSSVNHRKNMLEIALGEFKNTEINKNFDLKKVRPCYIELDLPAPTYTANTLRELGKIYPQFHFSIIMGQDNADILNTWREGSWIKENYPILVYPRMSNNPKIQKVRESDTTSPPLLYVSASEIRVWLKEYYSKSGKVNETDTVKNYLPLGVLKYILVHNLYRERMP